MKKVGQGDCLRGWEVANIERQCILVRKMVLGC